MARGTVESQQRREGDRTLFVLICKFDLCSFHRRSVLDFSAHEVAHLRELNHPSSRFWRLVHERRKLSSGSSATVAIRIVLSSGDACRRSYRLGFEGTHFPCE